VIRSGSGRAAADRSGIGAGRELTAAPDLDGRVIVEQLLKDLAPLDDRVWLVADVRELGPEALRQLELLIMRAPAGLQFVLVTRHDVQLGLHRLCLEGDLAEIREPDLRSAAITRTACHGHGPGHRRDQSPCKAPGALVAAAVALPGRLLRRRIHANRVTPAHPVRRQPALWLPRPADKRPGRPEGPWVTSRRRRR